MPLDPQIDDDPPEEDEVVEEDPPEEEPEEQAVASFNGIITPSNVTVNLEMTAVQVSCQLVKHLKSTSKV